MRITGYILALTLIVSGCQSSDEVQVSDCMDSFVYGINNQKTDLILEQVYPPVFDVVSKKEIAQFYVDRGAKRRKLIVKKLNKLYGPYEHNDDKFILAEFRIQKGKVLLKKQDVVAFIFGFDEDSESWKIIPFAYGDSYKWDFMRIENLSSIDEPDQLFNMVPKEVLEAIENEYIPGSED